MTSDADDGSIGSIPSDYGEKRKINRAANICGIMAKGLTFVPPESQKDRRAETYSKKWWLKTSQVNPIHRPTYSRTPKQHESQTEQNKKEFMPRHIIIKVLNTKD